MSTLAFPILHHHHDQIEVATPKTQKLPDSRHVADDLGHEGELAFRRHAIAVYNGYMAATVLIASFYVALVWAFFKLQ